MTELRIRNSELSLFMRCQRSWMLGYYRQLQPDWALRREPQHYDVGIATHAGLGGYYNDGDWQSPMADLQAEIYGGLHPEADMKAWHKTFEMACRMVEHYIEWVADTGADIGDETVAIEQRIEIPITVHQGFEVYLHGQPDRIVSTPSGIIIEDWKTLAKVDRPFMMESDWQLLNYIMMARTIYGEMPLGARHRQLVRSMHTARAKAEQYAQHMVSVNEHRLNIHWQHVLTQVRLLVDKKVELDNGLDPVTGCTPNRLPQQCRWDCNFKDVCPLMDDGADYEYILDNEFRIREDSE